MKRKSLLIMLLVALFVPLAMNAQKKASPSVTSMKDRSAMNVQQGLTPMRDLSSVERISLKDLYSTTHSNEYDNNRDMRATGDYELVTASQTDWSGEYVIAYVASSTSATVLSGKSTGNTSYGTGTSVSLNNNVLAASNVESHKVTIAKTTYNNNTVYTLYLAGTTNYYLGLTSNNNRLNFATSLPTSNPQQYYWTIAYSNNTLTITSVYQTSRRIQWNNATNNGQRFACYTGTQQEISLFKKIESSCAKPEGLTVDETSITTNSATATWTAGDATLWNLRYKNTEASTWTTVNGLTAATYTFSGLTAATEYEVQVQADCGDEPSEWTSSVEFITECDIQSLPFFCGFETTEQVICWSGYNWADNTNISSSNYHAGSYCFMFAGSSSLQYLISPEFNGTSAIALSFYYRVRSSSYAHYFQVGYATESDLSDLTFGSEVTATNQSYSEYTATFPKGTKFVVLACGANSGTYYNFYVDDFNFTDPGCVAPNGLEAADITPFSANLSWSDFADSYNVRYRKVVGEQTVFFDGFESGDLTTNGWTTVASSYSSTNTNWHAYNAGNFSSGTVTNHTGDYSAMSRSYDGSRDRSVDNWLITPQVQLNGELRYWVRNGDGAGYYEDYAIYVSTRGNSTSDFTLLYDPNDETDTWIQHVVDLSSFNGANGYIAIRHTDYAKDFLLIDDFGVYNVTYGPWTTLPADGNNLPIAGLDPESTYQWQVQSDCGDDTSDWSAAADFQTLDACAAPVDLNATDITSASATLNWAGYQESYDVRYRRLFFYEDFENGIPSTWTKIDSDGDGNNWLALSDIPSTYSQYANANLDDWAHNGSNAACSPSYVNTSSTNGTAFDSDQWLITPLVDLGGVLKFYATSAYADEFEVKLSTTGTAVSDFTTTLRSMTASTDSWEEVIIDLSSYQGQGYIGIHHVFEDGYFLIVDDFSISESTWGTASASTNSVAINGLTPEADYEWQVSGANCDNWSDAGYFTTLEFTGILVTSITASDVTVLVGETTTITPTILPTDATNQAVTYTSDDETVATVGENNGLVTAVGPGTATITIAATDGSGVTGTCTVTVNPILVGSITASDITVVNGQTAQISYQVDPTTATDPSVTFTSADPTIATVDATTGEVTGVSVGTTTITIAANDASGVSTTIEVTVTPNPNAVQFTVNAPTNAQPGDVITVEAVMAAPTNGNYDGFNALLTGIYFDNTAFELVSGSITNGAVAQQAQQMGAMILSGYDVPGVAQLTIASWNGTVTAEGVVFSAQFTVLEETEGSFEFYAKPVRDAEFTLEGVFIPYEYTPSTVEVYVPEQYTLPIIGYNTEEGNGSGNFYLIASPIGTVDPSDVDNMIPGTPENYDLYYFDQDTDGNGNEWINYKGDPTHPMGGFDLEIGKGYLYANSNSIDLVFTGRSISQSTYTVTLEKNDKARFAGWNLVGNPFAQIAYIDREEHYTMDANGATFVASSNNTVDPMLGIFVVAEEDGEPLIFSTEPIGQKSPMFALDLSQNHSLLDRTIVRFGQGRQLPKLQFNRNSSKIYIPMDDKDYAVVRAEEMGEMPLNFKAESNGTYNLNLTTDNVEFAYLHLIDNLTGNDVDLLSTPSYSFEASTTDYESRFKLVFATGNNSNDDNFAFFSNGSFVINNEGEATLQVIDVTGRVLKSETINGCANVNVDGAAGVYMLRLINGDNMKVQKVVVK